MSALPAGLAFINVSKLLTVDVTHDEAVGRDFGRPRAGSGVPLCCFLLSSNDLPNTFFLEDCLSPNLQ